MQMLFLLFAMLLGNPITITREYTIEANPLMGLDEDLVVDADNLEAVLLAHMQEMPIIPQNINERDPLGNTALISAVKIGRPKLVVELIKHGADVNVAKEDGTTALTLAIINGDAEIAGLLVDAGATDTP